MAFLDFAGELAAVAGAICFGLGNVLIKYQGNKIKPTAINAIRITFSALIYFIIISATGLLKQTFSLGWKTSTLLISGSILGIVFGDISFFFSQQLIGLSRAYPIAVSYPFFIYIFGMIINVEEFNWFRILGMFLVITGIYLVSTSTRKKKNKLRTLTEKKEQIEESTPIQLKNHDEENQTNSQPKKTQDLQEDKKKEISLTEKKRFVLGLITAFVTTICWTAGTLLLDISLTTEINGLSANAIRMIGLAPLSIGIFFIADRGNNKSDFSWKSFWVIFAAGLIGNTVGGLLYIFALTYSTPSTTAAITAASPLVASPLSIIFLKEKFTWKLVIGTILTICGIWLIIIFPL
ncbi:MAG: DMT family transporter [Asgard group archaeon]|nr:DMT family transporter [Asgard group archaeon]